MTGSRRRFVFGEYELLPERRLLLRNGQEVGLASKTFDALVLLVEGSPEVVTKEDLTAVLWPDTTVADGNLSQQILTLRKALGGGRWVETVPKRGYQFVGEVELLVDESSASAISTPASPKPAGDEKWWRRWRWHWWALAGLAIFGLASYALWRPHSQSEDRSSESLVNKYVQWEQFTSEGFPEEEQFVADAITHSIRYRIESATKSWPESMFEPWKYMTRTGHVRKEDGRFTVDVQLLDSRRKPIWHERYSQTYPGGEPLIGDVIGEHFVRLFEQGQRRTSPGSRVFDALRDFSLKTNPQSPWKYGQVRDATGIGFRHFPYAYAGEATDGWNQGTGVPDHGVIGRVKKAKPLELPSRVYPPDAIWMSTGSQFTVLRWVAPADGTYSVHGRIRVADTVGRPCRVKLVHNTLHVLLERRNFAGFGSTIPVDIPELPLTQGSALDLIFGPEIGVDYLSLDVQLTVRPSIVRVI
jgi:DNA-binding winged helix-turn-helix (wHTH) protein